MTEQSKPRQFLITDHTDNSGFSAVEVAYAVEHLSCNVIHVIEKSHADALEQRVKELEEANASMFGSYAEIVNLKAEKEQIVRIGVEGQREINRKLSEANAELSRKLAKAVEQRNQMTATFWANCDYLTATESEKRYDDQISELDEELNGDK